MPDKISIDQCCELQYPDDPYGTDRLRVLALQDELERTYRAGRLHGTLERSPDGLGLVGERILTRASIAQWWIDSYDEEPGELMRCWLLNVSAEDSRFGACDPEVREWVKRLSVPGSGTESSDLVSGDSRAQSDLKIGTRQRERSILSGKASGAKRRKDAQENKDKVLAKAGDLFSEKPSLSDLEAARHAVRRSKIKRSPETVVGWIREARRAGDPRFPQKRRNRST